MNKNVFIRADGSPRMGLGHITRCLALAQMIKTKFRIIFIAKEMPEKIRREILNEGFSVKEIGSETEFLSILKGDEIAVIDHYEFDSEYQKKIKDKGSMLVCIDDLHNKEFHADLIINHAPWVKPHDYIAQSYSKFALGPDYILLRPEFLQYVKKNKEWEREQTKNIFICFGGSDAKNLSVKILEYFPEGEFELRVVVGPAFPFIEQLERVIDRRSKLEIEVVSNLSAKEIADELSLADLAIVPASGILLEAMAIGIPVISGFCVDNQIDIYKGLLKEKIFYSANDFNRESFLAALSQINRNANRAMVKNQKRFIDGQSPSRICNEFLNLC